MSKTLAGEKTLGGIVVQPTPPAYQEGFWTPGFNFLSTPNDYTLTTTNCKYVKIGKMVTCSIGIVYEYRAGLTNPVFLNNFPFKIAAQIGPKACTSIPLNDCNLTGLTNPCVMNLWCDGAFNDGFGFDGFTASFASFTEAVIPGNSTVLATDIFGSSDQTFWGTITYMTDDE